MKRAGNLIQKISHFDNLQLAYYKAKKGKEAKLEVIKYAKNLTQNLKILQQEIETGNVNVGNYHFFTIYEPKERKIVAASFSERVLHHAIMNICHPYFEKKLIYDTYATRKNKGTYKALDRAKIFTKKNKYFVKFDIRKYFDSIDHTILNKMLECLFKDKILLTIFKKIINSYPKEKGKGLAIGNLTSQYFANRYLGDLDHFIKHTLRIKAYVRYMDDFVIWHNSKDVLINASKQIEIFLKQQLNLVLKYKQLNKSYFGLSFLSYRLFPNKITLTQKAKKRFKTKIKYNYNKLKTKEWTQEQFAEHTRALTAFTAYAYSKKFRNCIING